MAYVQGPTSITYTFTDDDGASSRETVKLPLGVSAVNIGSWAATYAGEVTAVSNAALTRYSITSEYYDDTFPVAAPGSDVENKGVFTFRTANNGSSSLTIPSIIEAVLIATGTRLSTYIDLANVLIAPVVAALVSGINVGGTVIAPATNNGIDLRSVKDAYKQNRSSQKSQGNRG